MGAQNSRSSFKNNSSMNAKNSYQQSEQLSFNNSNDRSYNKDVDIWTTFTWNRGGNTVLLTGSFNRWKLTIPLQKRGDQFSITINSYKFIVDGQWRFSPDDPSMPDTNGNINNYIDTTNFYSVMENKKSEYSGVVFDQNVQKGKIVTELSKQILERSEQFPKKAPILPVHYEYCESLSEASAEKNSNANFDSGGKPRITLGQMMDVEEEDKKKFELSLDESELRSIFNSCHCLEPPTHVTVDHIISSTRKQYQQIAITQRFKSKYTTYRYYS